MNLSLLNIKRSNSLPFRVTAVWVIICFCVNMVILPPAAQAQGVPGLPAVGTLVNPTPSFNPAIAAGLTIYPQNPFQFDFIIDTGDDQLQGDELRVQSQKLIHYFLASLTVPEDQMWVNLSPDEPDRIIPDSLSLTEMGRDMLAQDYLLKQLTASLMIDSPSNQILATSNQQNRIWIVPQTAKIFVKDNHVFIADSHLKVMVEEDYYSQHERRGKSYLPAGQAGELRDTKSERSIYDVPRSTLDKIEKEVNEGKHFAPLRQIYHSMILASWYKKQLKDSVGDADLQPLRDGYIDQNKIDGVNVVTADVKEHIYQQYLEAFKVGVYNEIKEEYDPATQQIIPKKYFSGGEHFGKLTDTALSKTNTPAPKDWVIKRRRSDKAMVAFKLENTDLSAQVDQATVASQQDPSIDLLRESFGEDGLNIVLNFLEISIQDVIHYSGPQRTNGMAREHILTVQTDTQTPETIHFYTKPRSRYLHNNFASVELEFIVTYAAHGISRAPKIAYGKSESKKFYLIAQAQGVPLDEVIFTSETDILKFIYQFGIALGEIHQATGCTHGDLWDSGLKTHHIFVDVKDNFHVSFIDFGQAGVRSPLNPLNLEQKWIKKVLVKFVQTINLLLENSISEQEIKILFDEGYRQGIANITDAAMTSKDTQEGPFSKRLIGKELAEEISNQIYGEIVSVDNRDYSLVTVLVEDSRKDKFYIEIEIEGYDSSFAKIEVDGFTATVPPLDPNQFPIVTEQNGNISPDFGFDQSFMEIVAASIPQTNILSIAVDDRKIKSSIQEKYQLVDDVIQRKSDGKKVVSKNAKDLDRNEMSVEDAIFDVIPYSDILKDYGYPAVDIRRPNKAGRPHVGFPLFKFLLSDVPEDNQESIIYINASRKDAAMQAVDDNQKIAQVINNLNRTITDSDGNEYRVVAKVAFENQEYYYHRISIHLRDQNQQETSEPVMMFFVDGKQREIKSLDLFLEELFFFGRDSEKRQLFRKKISGSLFQLLSDVVPNDFNIPAEIANKDTITQLYTRMYVDADGNIRQGNRDNPNEGDLTVVFRQEGRDLSEGEIYFEDIYRMTRIGKLFADFTKFQFVNITFRADGKEEKPNQDSLKAFLNLSNQEIMSEQFSFTVNYRQVSDDAAMMSGRRLAFQIKNNIDGEIFTTVEGHQYELHVQLRDEGDGWLYVDIYRNDEVEPFADMLVDQNTVTMDSLSSNRLPWNSDEDLVAVPEFGFLEPFFSVVAQSIPPGNVFHIGVDSFEIIKMIKGKYKLLGDDIVRKSDTKIVVDQNSGSLMETEVSIEDAIKDVIPNTAILTKLGFSNFNIWFPSFSVSPKLKGYELFKYYLKTTPADQIEPVVFVDAVKADAAMTAEQSSLESDDRPVVYNKRTWAGLHQDEMELIRSDAIQHLFKGAGIDVSTGQHDAVTIGVGVRPFEMIDLVNTLRGIGNFKVYGVELPDNAPEYHISFRDSDLLNEFRRVVFEAIGEWEDSRLYSTIEEVIFVATPLGRQEDAGVSEIIVGLRSFDGATVEYTTIAVADHLLLKKGTNSLLAKFEANQVFRKVLDRFLNVQQVNQRVEHMRRDGENTADVGFEQQPGSLESVGFEHNGSTITIQMDPIRDDLKEISNAEFVTSQTLSDSGIESPVLIVANNIINDMSNDQKDKYFQHVAATMKEGGVLILKNAVKARVGQRGNSRVVSLHMFDVYQKKDGSLVYQGSRSSSHDGKQLFSNTQFNYHIRFLKQERLFEGLRKKLEGRVQDPNATPMEDQHSNIDGQQGESLSDVALDSNVNSNSEILPEFNDSDSVLLNKTRIIKSLQRDFGWNNGDITIAQSPWDSVKDVDIEYGRDLLNAYLKITVHSTSTVLDLRNKLENEKVQIEKIIRKNRVAPIILTVLGAAGVLVANFWLGGDADVSKNQTGDLGEHRAEMEEFGDEHANQSQHWKALEVELKAAEDQMNDYGALSYSLFEIHRRLSPGAFLQLYSDVYFGNLGSALQERDGLIKRLEEFKKGLSLEDVQVIAEIIDVLDQAMTADRHLVTRSERLKPAPLPTEKKYGGIDFNAGKLDLQTQGDAIQFDLPKDFLNIRPDQIKGLTPVIINITPLPNFSQMLGLKEVDDMQVLSRL